MAARLVAEYAALPATPPTVAAPAAAQRTPAELVIVGDDDDDGDLDEGFYDDAFEVLS
jgi:hypothetical protein